MDEGYYVPPELLARLGGGDPKAGRKVLRALIDIETAHEPILGPTQKPDTVRTATPDDHDALMDLIRLDIAENALPIAPLDEDKVVKFISAPVTEGGPTIGVIDGPSGLEGMIGLVPFNWWWATPWAVMEQWNYVRPDRRASKHGADLIRFSRWLVDDMSDRVGYRVFLLSGVTATKDAARKVALYRRLSNYVGAFFCYPDPTFRDRMN